MNITLRLLLNLSFDSVTRAQIIKAGLLPKLVDLLNNENQRIVSMCILYHLSMDDNSKSMFTFTNCIDNVIRIKKNITFCVSLLYKF